MNDRLVPTSSQTDLPTITIQSSGTPIPNEIQLSSVTVSHAINKIPTALIVLMDGDAAKEEFKVSSSDVFVPGKEIEILAGYHSDEVSIFKGIITSNTIRAHSNQPSVLEVVCKDKAVKMTINRQSANFVDQKDSDVCTEIVESYGLSAVVSSTEIQHKSIVQFNATDWDFVIGRAEMNGHVVKVNASEVTIEPPNTSANPALTLIYGATLLDFEAEMDAQKQVQSVLSHSWDFANQERIEASGEEPDYKGPGNLSPSDLADVLATGNFTQPHNGAISHEELAAWSNARLLRSRLAKIVGRARCQGTDGIKTGEMVELKGLGDRFSGPAYVTAVRHHISLGNWESDIQFGLKDDWFANVRNFSQLPAGGLLPAVDGLQIGTVLQLQDDPDGEDRILIQLAIFDDDGQGIWARIATLDAGDNRGSFFRPEIGDEMLVGFINDDPRNPIVLGMLNSSAKPAPLAASDDNHEKGFITRDELKILFDDDKKHIVLETPGGNRITLSDDETKIFLEDQNGNTCLMNPDGVSIESAKDIILKASGDIKLEGTNLEFKASAEFKAEGGAGVKLESSAVAELKGSLVKIN